jgi:osmoprotectant transport system permease protein
VDILLDGLAWLVAPEHWTGADGIPTRLIEHLTISGVSLLVAVLIALPLGLFIGHTGRGALLAVNVANIGRAVPSYAVLVMILPISLRFFPQSGGLDFIPTFGAMTLLAIPPIVINAYAGLREVDRELVEAARGMGMRERQILRRVELPLALPVVLGGLRTASVQVIATATLGAIVALGGLGRYIIDGIARREYDRMVAGVILVAALAIAVELVFIAFQRLAVSPGLRRRVDTADRSVVPPGGAGGI